MSQEASARDVPVKACAEELTMDLTEFDVVTMVMRLVLKTHSGFCGVLGTATLSFCRFKDVARI